MGREEKNLFEEEEEGLGELEVRKECPKKKLGEASWLPDTVEVPVRLIPLQRNVISGFP